MTCSEDQALIIQFLHTNKQLSAEEIADMRGLSVEDVREVLGNSALPFFTETLKFIKENKTESFKLVGKEWHPYEVTILEVFSNYTSKDMENLREFVATGDNRLSVREREFFLNTIDTIVNGGRFSKRYVMPLAYYAILGSASGG